MLFDVSVRLSISRCQNFITTSGELAYYFKRKLKNEEPSKLSISIPSFNEEIGLKLEIRVLAEPWLVGSYAVTEKLSSRLRWRCIRRLHLHSRRGEPGVLPSMQRYSKWLYGVLGSGPLYSSHLIRMEESRKNDKDKNIKKKLRRRAGRKRELTRKFHTRKSFLGLPPGSLACHRSLRRCSYAFILFNRSSYDRTWNGHH
uniref:Uncharacterized protein n=1 Tax=Timema poppense TaxID=170557 RepID=A0A7R9H2P3_TIMPO|nr:unnamed protein product [Timema poppensis]